MMDGDDISGLDIPDVPMPEDLFDFVDEAGQEAEVFDDVDVDGGDDLAAEFQGLSLDIDAGIHVLQPPAVDAARPKGVFRGLNRSKAHMAYVRMQKQVNEAKSSATAVKTQYRGLKKAWDSKVLRVGDQARDLDDDISPAQRDANGRALRRKTHLEGSGVHVNEWTTDAVLRIAFGSIGGRRGFARRANMHRMLTLLRWIGVDGATSRLGPFVER